MKKRLIYITIMASVLLTGCQDTDDLTAGADGIAVGEMIHVGGINTDELVATASVTRAEVDTVTKTDAENISWLVDPLKTGLDITYGLSSNRSGTSRVAILKLLTDGDDIKYSKDTINGKPYQYAEYSFKYRNNSNGEPTDTFAIWHGNGAHFFEGLYVPDEIEFDASKSQTISDVPAKNLTSDQHNDGTTTASLGNYTLLTRYLGMPSNYTVSATVARIKLPFRHRLARVLAYILIDPSMGDSVKIQGYMKKADGVTDSVAEDPTTSKIRFSNVKVLEGVKKGYDADTKHYTFTPQWTEIRKAIPHFVGERGSYNDRTNKSIVDSVFVAFYNTSEKTYIYPDDTEWATINAKTFTNNKADGYERIIYGKVPVYDLIVRPTYTSLSNVMYDEEITTEKTKNSYYVATNHIDFDITLNNGLQYSKRFNFDLNANYQTVVYLHISRERIDYNSSGSELWVTTTGDDGYYGVNNQNGNTLSLAGSGWQRAYTNSSASYTITDGHYYQQDSEDRYAQYVDDNTWIEMLREACKDGKHHGDYFILNRDISIPAAAFPENFVFTGHLDGQDHTITLTNADYTAARDAYEAYDNASLTKYIKSGNNYVTFTPDDNTTYYQKSGDTYTAINDISAYSGSTAYTRTENTPTYSIVSEAWKLSSGSYYKKNGSSYEAIEDITTYLSAFNNKIYTRQQNADFYTAVSTPSGNPHDQGWYELNGTTYSLTEDTTVNTEKTYYTKDEVSYTFTAVSDVTTLESSVTYYYNDGDNYIKIDNLDDYIGVYSQVITYNYTAINFYKFVHYNAVIGSSTGTPTNGYMFSGLNGKYSTAQEDATDPTTVVWEANVHKETRYNTYWVPYKTNVDGWRAEVINLKVSGGKLFKDGMTYPPTENATVTGYVHNCWEGTTKVTEYTPAIPVYKE